MSVRSKEFSTLLMISRSDFLSLIKSSEKDYESFCSIKDSLLLYKRYDVLGMSCYSCGNQQHLIHKCPYIHEVVNRDRLIAQLIRNVN